MKLVKVIGLVGCNKQIRYINLKYVTDIHEYIYLGIWHITISINNNSNSLRITLDGDDRINFMKEITS